MNIRKEVTGDKLQGSVATYSSCGGIANNHIKNSLLLSLPMIFLICEYFAKLQARRWRSHALCLPGHHTAKRLKIHQTS